MLYPKLGLKNLILDHTSNDCVKLKGEMSMKTKFSMLLLAVTITAVLSAGVAYAGCNPKCPKGVSCRYDSTKKPTHWCDSSSGAKGISSKTPGSPGGREIKKVTPGGR